MACLIFNHLQLHSRALHDRDEIIGNFKRLIVINTFIGQAHLVSIEIGDDELAEIGLIMEMRRDFSLSAYKDKYIKRRISKRIYSCSCDNAAAYCNLLRQSEQELDLLQKALTIHVSQFFRNPSMFEKLRSDILPSLFANCEQNGHNLRAWSLGCAGGEEAFSLAIIFREHFAAQLKYAPPLIDAIDIDRGTLQSAIKGEYGEDRLRDMPDELKVRYFRQKGSLMQLSQPIRDMVTFDQGNITSLDKYLPHDLVLCRNTLIYFTRADQEKILNGIADNLPSGGILVLGKSETLVGDVRHRFSAICPVERIYRRN